MQALSDTSQMWAQTPAPGQSKIPLAQDLAIGGGGRWLWFPLGRPDGVGSDRNVVPSSLACLLGGPLCAQPGGEPPGPVLRRITV